jgi:hypothetical protein
MDLGEMTLAEICIHVAEEAAKKAGVVGEITEDLLAFTMDVADEISSFGQNSALKIVADPLAFTFCRHTAARLFSLFGAEDADLSYEFTPFGTLAQQRSDTIGLLRELAGIVRRAVANREPTIFQIKYANHEFVVVARNGRAELLQSFMTKYTLGWSLKNNVPLDPVEIEGVLLDMPGQSKAALETQRLHFGACLKNDSADVVFGYKKASLATDNTIHQRLRDRMEKNLRIYTSIACQPSAILR